MQPLYDFIKVLYEHLDIYIIPANNANQHIEGPHFTYKVLADEIGDITNEVDVDIEEHTTYRVYNQNYQLSISFLAKAAEKEVAREMIGRLKDALTHEVVNYIYYTLDIVILDVGSIMDVTFKVVDNNIYQYNVDVTLRGSKEIRSRVDRIETAKIQTEVDNI